MIDPCLNMLLQRLPNTMGDWPIMQPYLAAVQTCVNSLRRRSALSYARRVHPVTYLPLVAIITCMPYQRQEAMAYLAPSALQWEPYVYPNEFGCCTTPMSVLHMQEPVVSQEVPRKGDRYQQETDDHCSRIDASAMRDMLRSSDAMECLVGLSCVVLYPTRYSENVSDVIQLLEVKERDVAGSAVSALTAYGVAAASAIPAVTKKLDAESDPIAFQRLLDCIASIGVTPDAMTVLVRKICNKNHGLSLMAEDGVLRLCGAKASMDLMLTAREQVASGSYRKRIVGVLALVAGGANPDKVLEKANDDDKRGVGLAGIIAVGLSTELSETDKRRLAKALESQDRRIRLIALAAVKSHGLHRNATDLIEEVIRCMYHNDADVRFFAARALGDVAGNDSVRKALAHAAEQQDGWVSAIARKVLAPAVKQGD